MQHIIFPAAVMGLGDASAHALPFPSNTLCVCFPPERSQHREGMKWSRWETENKPCEAELVPASSLPCAALNHIIAV